MNSLEQYFRIDKFTFGMGDRFAHQGEAQLSAVIEARKEGIPVFPVWNKSNREHQIVHSVPDDLRSEADAAVKALEWNENYYVDADHIGLKTVDGFLAGSNFFTLDVADFVGKPATPESVEAFVEANRRFCGSLKIEGIDAPVHIDEATLRGAAGKFLLAIQEAGKIHRHIAAAKGADSFVTEVSVDETDVAQSPVDLFLILSMIAAEGIPAQTIAPKFTGRFNKGVDYVGDVKAFEKEFHEDLCVIRFAVKTFGLPDTLKLSVHSGSDKFSIYGIINRLIKQHGAGLHVKTAGTTWLEELIGLAEADGEALALAKTIYAKAFARFDELSGPYRTVIDIDPVRLPSPEEVQGWNSVDYQSALRHDQSNPKYNQHFRQLLHVGFKIAAEEGAVYTEALKSNREVIARNVRTNLLERHIRPILQGVS